MKTFEEFYKDHIDSCAVYSEKMTAKWAWEAATLAERERLKKAISSDYKFIEENYISLPGETGQYYGGRLDSYFEVLYAIDNP